MGEILILFKNIKLFLIFFYNKFVFFCKKNFVYVFIVITISYLIYTIFTISGGPSGESPFSKDQFLNIRQALYKTVDSLDTTQFDSCFLPSESGVLFTLDYQQLVNISNMINKRNFISLIKPDQRADIEYFLNVNSLFLENTENIFYTKLFATSTLFVCFTIFLFLAKFSTDTVLI